MTLRDRGGPLVIAGGMLAVVMFAISGCGGDAEPSSGDAGPGSGEVTYYEHVRPILAEHCVSCHVAGSIGRFPLDTYETASALATRIAEVTRQRIMPPFLADNSGDCRTHRDANWLTDEELDLLEAWDVQGEPEGDPATPEPVIPPLPTLDGAVTSIETPSFVPNRSVSDDYRCFVVDADEVNGRFVTGYEVHPGNKSIVHHVIVYVPFGSDAVREGERARELDAAEGEVGDGYTCYGASRVNAMPVVLWAPGGGATNFPRGTGIQIAEGVPLIVQVHYNTLGGSGADLTRIDVETAESASPAFMVPIADFDMVLPPRMSSVSTSATISLDILPVSSVRVHGVFPHMHTLGRSMRVDVNSSDGDRCLVDVPRWDFNWQLAYWYTTPVRVSSQESVTITCTFDTSERTEPVTWGEGTQDEMCLNFVYLTI